MKNFVVWLDSKNAHVFALKTTGIEKTIVSKSEKDHHTRHKHDRHQDHQTGHYYGDLASKLKGADQVLLIGPGLSKNHFKKYLKIYHAHTLSTKLIGLEQMESFEHKTEKQMLAKARQFFKTYDLFNNPIGL